VVVLVALRRHVASGDAAVTTEGAP
jgi:hypothetical protein